MSFTLKYGKNQNIITGCVKIKNWCPKREITSGTRKELQGRIYYKTVSLKWRTKSAQWMNVKIRHQFSHSVVSDSLRPHESQHARPPCPSPTPRVHPNSCPSSWWCHQAILFSVTPFSSCPQSLPASESFPMSQLLLHTAVQKKSIQHCKVIILQLKINIKK